MELSEINRVLRDKAVKAGLCDEWQSKIWNRDLSIEELLYIYKKGIDFSVKNKWFSYDFIKKAFQKDELHKANIYLDEEVDLDGSESGIYVFTGNCNGTLVIDGLVAVTVYVLDSCNVSVKASGGAKVFVSYYHDSSGSCLSDGFSTIKKYMRQKKEG